MKKELYSCDRCGKDWDLKYNPSAYVLSRLSLTGAPIMGDNRIPQELHICDECFNEIFPIFAAKKKEERKMKFTNLL